MTTQIYNRFDPAKGHESVLFRADRVLQSAELNELQSMQAHRLRGLADVLFKEGDIIRGCQCITVPSTGATTVEAGALYVAGAVRGIAPAQLQVNPLGTVYVGVYLQSRTITEQDDPALYNPAAGTRGYGEAGAAREVVTLAWGVQGDGTPGTFYPVWTIVDGWVMPKEPPPNIDAVTQALVRYDRDSAGGTYVVSGLQVIMGADLPTGQQVYTVREGVARVNGHALELGYSRRLVHDAQPDLQWVDSEPHTSAGVAAQRVPFDRVPAVGVPQVRIQARRTVTLTHGGFAGAADPLPDEAVLLIEAVTQAGVPFAQGADWKLTGCQVDWSPAGAEPAPGSAYDVTYQYMLNVVPTAVDSTGFTVEGALPNTLILTSYNFALRRFDRLVMDAQGTLQWVKGVPATWSPKVPPVPAGVLALATVYQSWDDSRRVDQDAVRVVPMQQLQAQQDQIALLRADLAELRLSVDVSGRHSGVKKGLFADPMIDNSLRDAGKPQSAHILGGKLMLPMDVTLHQIGQAITAVQTTPYNAVPVLSQLARTGSMLVNPYGAFDVLPRKATLTPAVDYWTDVDTQWVNPIVLSLTPSQSAQNKETQRVQSQSTALLEHLRPIEVAFWLDFPVNETLASVTFDGIAVDAQPLAGGDLVATAEGLRGTFTIPEGVPAGTKPVVFTGAAGTVAETVFTGQGELLTQSVSRVTVQLYDPLAQTFTLTAPREICGVHLWFTTKGVEDVQVQIRAVVGGVPSRTILTEATLKPAQIAVGAATAVAWPALSLEAGVEYALVVLTNDAVTALAIAQLGGWDEHLRQHVTSQPYSVGVLLSSSNASTWTPHQTDDLAFELLATEHTANVHMLELGTVAVEDATDLMIQAGAVLPAAAAGVVVAMQLDNGTSYEAAPGQAVQLPSRYTGNVIARARLSGDAHFAAHLLPGMQLVVGSVQTAGDYITPAITAGNNVDLHVVVEALMPAGAALLVHMQAEGAQDWVEVPYLSSSPQTAGVLELTYRLQDVSADRLRVRLLLSGSHSARPEIANLRVVVV